MMNLGAQIRTNGDYKKESGDQVWASCRSPAVSIPYVEHSDIRGIQAALDAIYRRIHVEEAGSVQRRDAAPCHDRPPLQHPCQIHFVVVILRQQGHDSLTSPGCNWTVWSSHAAHYINLLAPCHLAESHCSQT